MRSGSFYDDLLELNMQIYKGGTDFKNFKFLDYHTTKSGLFIKLFERENELFFVIKGTDNGSLGAKIKDLYSDLVMFCKLVPQQYKPAEDYFNSLKDVDKSRVIFTGHSLGGSVAQLLGSKYGNETVTFEAYGTADINGGGSYTNNIINFGNEYDPVFIWNVENQRGIIKIMDIQADKISTTWHYLEHCGTPSKAHPPERALLNIGTNFKKTLYTKTSQYIDDMSTRIKKYIPDEVEQKSKELLHQFKNHI